MSPQTPSPPPVTPPPPIRSSLHVLPLPSPPAQAQPLLPLFRRRRWQTDFPKADSGSPTSAAAVIGADAAADHRRGGRQDHLLSGAASFPGHRFLPFSAVSAGVEDVRDAVDDARKSHRFGGPVTTVLFVDEVHRFNKAQQDSFLPSIEDGSIVFLGATTENPSFHIITPLLSRCRVLKLNPLAPTDIAGLLSRAADDCERGLPLSIGPCRPPSPSPTRSSISCHSTAMATLGSPSTH